MRRLERLVAIALFLGTRRRVLARDVAETFGISLRTVYRDVRALVEAGFPVEGTAGDGYRLPQASYLRPLALTGEEAEALTIAAYALDTSAAGGARDALARATTKLEAAMDAGTRRRVLQLRARIVVPDRARRAAAPTAEMLDAIRDARVAHLAYVDPRTGARTRRDVEPLGFVCCANAWWLVAWCRLRGDGRAFRVDAIERWTSRTARYAPRAGGSFAELIARDGHLGPSLFGY